MKKNIKVKNKNPEKVNYRELEHRYRLLSELMDSTPDVIYFKDREGKLVMVNQAHAKGLGLKPDQVVGKTDFDFFPRERAKLMSRDDMRVMKTGKAIIDKIERATRPDGVDNYVSTTKIPRYDDRGMITGLIGITRDITHRVQVANLQEENTRIQKKLEVAEDLNNMKSEFVSVVSHELRTPLAIIKEAVMLIYEGIAGPLSEKQKYILSKAKDNIGRLNGIIEDLLEVSRIERGALKLHYSLVDLKELLLDSSEYFKKISVENGITLKYALPEEQVNVFIDAARINQVVSNLVTNAIKFTHQNDSIRIELEILENKVRIGVIDTGVGIAKDNLSELFNKFTQVSKNEAIQRKGLGLGLFITRELVERHGGEIWADSKLGAGSKFYFTLPRFYTAKVLNDEVRNSVNKLLNKGTSIYLVNVLVVNFKEFKKAVKTQPKELFYGIRKIIDEALKRFNDKSKRLSRIAFEDYSTGEWSILFSGADEGEIASVCESLKSRIKAYFSKLEKGNVFINLGTLHYSDNSAPSEPGQVFADIYIKKLSIGSEIRRFKRISYKVAIEVMASGDKTESCQGVDISEGGLCFTTGRQMETGSKINIKLSLPNKREPLNIRARVAWRKAAKETKDNAQAYNVGLEFTDIKDRERKYLSLLLRAVSGARKP
ncbi:MAG: PAS domain-containing protein [Candidatus Omnitrophica bacterium]|nr:PAS domain-containing protein [Candidatus Omnitrophota bacterium]